MTLADYNPLITPPPEEVPLENAPLIRVLAQVRFPSILSIEEKSFVAPFQEVIRDTYPILQPEQTRGLVIGPSGITSSSPKMVWRFFDISGNWRISLAPDFLAIETTAYSSRSDFLARLEKILIALNEHIKPKIIERFGLRYVDRLDGEDMENLSTLVRSEVAGIISSGFGDQIHQNINESLFKLPGGEGQILARWGLLPANATVDPSAIEPVDKPSWVLDLDMSLVEQREFSVENLMSDAQRFAERIYAFFRWAVTQDFLRRFGGDV
ncbi:MAG: TIGR04255 family protein [Cyanobacteria bacterium J06614_10]